MPDESPRLIPNVEDNNSNRDTAPGEEGSSQETTTNIINPSEHIINPFAAPFERPHDAERICRAPYDYIQSLHGKNTIGKFIGALQTWFKLPRESAGRIEEICVKLVNTALMLDDIQDESERRRGEPAAHLVFGQGQTFNSVMYLYIEMCGLVHQLGNNASMAVFHDESRTLTLGQGLDLYWRQNATCPSVEEYLVMVDNKTGGFFRLALRLMEAESPAPPPPMQKLLHFITLLGRFYQIRDDYQNLASDEYTAKKGFCDDLSEGKFSLPLIHFLNASPAAGEVRGMLFCGEEKKVNLTQEKKAWILSEMKAAGSLEYVRDIIVQLQHDILKALADVELELEPNIKLRELVVGLGI